ncbi:class I SAM-dependent methyltransferase [Rothia sp. P5766]|uniref:class I SAM-dependent methyltransferase n=1 Tax=Rothia sp. P5766 TaxID=3402656 RepID=UPI003AEE5236
MSTKTHYFSEEPAGDFATKPLTVELAADKVQVLTAPGIFSPGGVDKGTRILLDEAPAPQGTRLLDIGCGWGPITLTLAMLAPEAQVYGVEVNPRAAQLTQMNAERLGLNNIRVSSPQALDESLTFDTIWSNPPIRVGKEVLHEIMQTWLPRLSPGGNAYLVVQKNLGSDSLQKWLVQTFPGLETSRYASSKGFRIIRVHRP